MKVSTKTTVVLLSIVFLAGVSYAEDFSGGWMMNANSATFALHIEQDGSQITGEMIPINGDPADASTIAGTIDGHIIRFMRSSTPLVPIPQKYVGALFLGQGNVCMSGFLKHENVWNLGWFACRQ